jgi:hypothetical protein
MVRPSSPSSHHGKTILTTPKTIHYFREINEKFQLHRIVTKFGVPGVLVKAIKSIGMQLWEYLGTGCFKKSYCTFHHPIFTLNIFFLPIAFSVQVSVDPKEHFRPLNRNLFFEQKWQKTVAIQKVKSFYFLHDILYR